MQVSGCQTLEKCLLIQEMGATNPEKVKMVIKNMETFMPKVRDQDNCVKQVNIRKQDFFTSILLIFR